jgi:hypothetical protein
MIRVMTISAPIRDYAQTRKCSRAHMSTGIIHLLARSMPWGPYGFEDVGE